MLATIAHHAAVSRTPNRAGTQATAHLARVALQPEACPASAYSRYPTGEDRND